MKIGVYIGRFQPFHLGHLSTLRAALSKYDKVVVVIGSAQEWGTEKNPFISSLRINIIKAALDSAELKRVEFVKINDNAKSDTDWAKNVINEVHYLIGDYTAEFYLTGCNKDSSSYYLEKLFPIWKLDLVSLEHTISATDIRKALFNGVVLEDRLHPSTVKILKFKLQLGPIALRPQTKKDSND